MESEVSAGMDLRWQIVALEFERLLAYASMDVIMARKPRFERNRLHGYPSR